MSKIQHFIQIEKSWLDIETFLNGHLNIINNAPFHKISNTSQCGKFALILWRLVNGSFFCVLGQIVTWQYNPNLLD